MQPFELRGPGVLLATTTLADVDRVTELCQDPEIQRWVTIPVPYRQEHAVGFVTEAVPSGWETGRELTWAIRDPEDRRVLGMISVGDRGGRVAEVGFWLGSDGRGQGLAGAAVRLVAEYVFAYEGWGAEHLRWQAMAGNWASRRVAWSTGFRIVDERLPGLLNQRGEPREGWIGTLSAGDPMRPRRPWFTVPDVAQDDVALRPFAASDVDAVVESGNDPASQHWLSRMPSPYTYDDAVAYIETREDEHASGTALTAAAARRDGGPAIGSFSLLRLGAIAGGAEVGYWVHPSARGTGVATTAVTLLADHAFTPESEGGLGLQRLVVAHAAGNEGSRRVIERVGFQPAGVERAAGHLRGGVVTDHWWYDLLADDWR